MFANKKIELMSVNKAINSEMEKIYSGETKTMSWEKFKKKHKLK